MQGKPHLFKGFSTLREPLEFKATCSTRLECIIHLLHGLSSFGRLDLRSLSHIPHLGKQAKLRLILHEADLFVKLHASSG